MAPSLVARTDFVLHSSHLRHAVYASERNSNAILRVTGVFHPGGLICGSSRFSKSKTLRSFGHRLFSSCGSSRAHVLCTVSAMDASIGSGGDSSEQGGGQPRAFPRLGVRDPYKRLGLDREATMEEVSEARAYLCEEYKGHEKSVEAIEAAYDQILQQKLRERKGSKINLKANLKKKVSEGPGWLRSLAGMVEVPKRDVLLQRACLYILLGAWSVMNPADGGPAFQVAVALAATIYLLNDRLKSLGRAFLLGFGALVVGWVIGSIVVPVAPSFLFPRWMSLELTTSLIAYVFLFFACTFLR